MELCLIIFVKGLPPIYGLYAACIPPLIYALLGSSMFLSIGPVAVTAILNASAVRSLNVGDDVATRIQVILIRDLIK